MIYTLEYLQKEAEGILGAWNGSDDRFNYEGEVKTEDDINAAADLLDKIREVKELIAELKI